MDFVFLPPEVNSARIYTGPGSGPLLAAAGSWDSLSAELSVTAGVYESVLSGLTSLQWRGPTAEAMSAAATPYLRWLQTTAEQAQQTAMQARAAAAAFELAHAMTVPPMAVTANQIQLAALIATNFFGQNTAAIAATEGQYAEYWAQDVTAMAGYAASSVAATRVTPFSRPHQTTAPAGLTGQQAAVNQASVSSAANVLTSQSVSQAAPAAAAALPAIIPTDLTILNVIQAAGTSLSGTWKMEATPTGIVGAEKDLGMLPAPAAAAAEAAPAPQGVASSVGGGAGLGNVTVTLGRADSIGSMSVPASWTTPQSCPVALLPGSGSPTMPVTAELAGSGSGMSGIPGMRPPYRATLVVPRYGVRPTVMTRPLVGG